jgi:hypothetical protein
MRHTLSHVGAAKTLLNSYQFSPPDMDIPNDTMLVHNRVQWRLTPAFA